MAKVFVLIKKAYTQKGNVMNEEVFRESDTPPLLPLLHDTFFTVSYLEIMSKVGVIHTYGTWNMGSKNFWNLEHYTPVSTPSPNIQISTDKSIISLTLSLQTHYVLACATGHISQTLQNSMSNLEIHSA